MSFQSTLSDVSPFRKMEAVPPVLGVNLNIHFFSEYLLWASCVWGLWAQSLHLLTSLPGRLTHHHNCQFHPEAPDSHVPVSSPDLPAQLHPDEAKLLIFSIKPGKTAARVTLSIVSSFCPSFQGPDGPRFSGSQRQSASWLTACDAPRPLLLPR